MKKIILGMALLFGSLAQAQFTEITGSYYQWANAQNGYGYCYQYTPQGYAMNEGTPQPTGGCERRNPSYFSWAVAQNGSTYCYQYTGNGIVMNQGSPVSNQYCR